METQNLVNIEYYLENWKPKLLLFFRENNNKKIIEIQDFLPYIYVNEVDVNGLKNMFSKDIVSIESTTKKYIKDENIKLYKVVLKAPYVSNKIKEIFKIYESDILYPNRFVIDNISKMTTSNYRINFLDIETTSEFGFPDMHTALEQIISLSSFDNILNKTFLWIWHKSYEKTVITNVIEDEIVEIRRFNNEIDMLNNFLDFIVSTKPDFISSWHVSFDINYLCARLEKLQLEWGKLSPLYDTVYYNKINDIIKWMKGGGVYGKRFGNTDREKHINIRGLIYFDLLTAYKNIVAKEQQSWKLDYIAQKELGINKLQTHFDIGEKWKNEPEFIEKYNYIDVLLIKKLDEKLKIINRYLSIKDKSFLYNINDVFSTGRVLDNYILKTYKDFYIFPSKIYDMSLDKRIAGGYVRLPVAGVYDNIAVFDFSGFYPSLMTTFNLSSEKLIKEEIQVFNPLNDETEKSDIDEINYVYDKDKKYITYKIKTDKFKADLTYDISKPGVLTTAVNDLIKLRTEAKKEMKKYEYDSIEYKQAYDNQFSYKFLINGVYGICAYPGFRLFALHNANAITSFARMLSKYVSNNLKTQGWLPIYNDTDSVFVQLKNKKGTLEENLEEINKEIMPFIQNTINEFVSKFLPIEYAQKHTLKMDIEKIYDRLLLMDVKKRYIGRLKYYEGKEVNSIHFMGMDLKKSNTTELAKKAQLDIAIAILNKDNYRNVIDKYYTLVLNSEDIDMYKIPSKLEKNQEEYRTNIPAKRGTLWSNKRLGTKFRSGTKFYLLYVKECDTDVIAFEEKEQLQKLKYKIDKDKYAQDLHNKICNLTRGLPDILSYSEQLLSRQKTKLTNLNNWLKP